MRAEAATGGVWRVACEAHAARGIVYATSQADWPERQSSLRPGGMPGRWRASPRRRITWQCRGRYGGTFTLPGIMETDLRDHARRLGADVSMWPNLDEFDLHIQLGRNVWRIDAKAWASPVALAHALLAGEPPGQHLEIVQFPTISGRRAPR